MKQHLPTLFYFITLIYLIFNENPFKKTRQKDTSIMICDFNISDLVEAFQYFPVHLCNWFFASLIAKDFLFLHVWSIFDELIEQTLSPVIDDMKECWWDTIILNILIANNISIYIGTSISKAQYDLFGRQQYGLKFWKWKYFHEPNRFILINITFLSISINLINGFLLMHVLQIQDIHIFNVYRLMVWFNLSNQAIYQNNKYLKNETEFNIQQNLIAIVIILAELFLICLNLQNITTLNSFQNISPNILLSWLIILMISVSYFVLISKQNKKQKE